MTPSRYRPCIRANAAFGSRRRIRAYIAPRPSLNYHGLRAGDSLQCNSGAIRPCKALFRPFVSYLVCYV